MESTEADSNDGVKLDKAESEKMIKFFKGKCKQLEKELL